ncbi:MAG: NYN domain-containing protein [Planctomycetota bacterium]|nr:NYN domain-containing protein [Planctomycetaceae bacterium]MDQ3329688.1 NYN domain-containing protein [Planctomycetota bacterium]
MSVNSEEPLIAVFVDFENLAIGVRDMKVGRFQIDLVLKRLLEKGRIVFKRAYCDWSHYQDAVREFHSQGVELIDIPQSKMSGKNSADIRMVVDALDLCYSKGHIDIFALISGDSDFSPLVSKLKENNKRVIGCGVKSSTSDLLVANSDEFLYYDDLIRAAKKTPAERSKPAKSAPARSGAAKAEPAKGKVVKNDPTVPEPSSQIGSKSEQERMQEAQDRVLEVLDSLEQDYDVLWGSMLKQAIRRVYPSFNEGYYGYDSFSDLLEDLDEKKLLRLDWDETRGNYKVRRGKG